mgnify:FL=1|jgi:DNA repair exonuclease SbcCD ATPase subunit
MEQTREQKKVQLQQAADALIEALLEWDEENRRPNLTQLEDEVLALRQQFGMAMAAVVLGGQSAQQPAVGEKCPQCGGELRYKGQKHKVVESRTGALDIARGYYYCARCRSGFFPPGPATGVG